ncbi:hypothetical protein [Sulfurospirillum arsenophilum]|uniref:hypothetical protein n=1 Tax=Sulfurospirillum arsenophilum TaxID=56698 RepID=UPI0005A7FD78|nr:hypothetical protein [Sulfurospirillum arsenophilum]
MKKDVGLKALLCLSALLVIPSMNATDVFPKTTLELTSDSGDTIGSITPGTKLIKLDEKSDKSFVMVNGWSAYGEESVIFQNIGQRVVYALLKPNAFRSIEKGQSKTDDYDAEWIPSQIKGWVKSSDLASNQEDVWKEGAKLFGERCGSCHQAHPSDEFTVNQWPNIVKAMKDRAGLLPEQQWQLTKYMQAHAKDAK